MIILVMGPQGSGKGTQAKLLADRLGYYYFDSGAMLREIAGSDKRIDEIVNKRGELVPDDEMYKLVTEYFTRKSHFDNIVMDGYPRSVVQYQAIKQWFLEHETQISKAIFLRVSDEVSVSRLSARRQDPVTGEIYNLITNPPGPEVDQARLVHREDDTPEAIKERLEHYHVTTQPLVQLLRKEGILIEIDGEQSIEKIHKEINAQV